jgi:hypothetical protein
MMGLGFFAPFFFAGMALLAIPLYIHRIRKPEREPVTFSSLMFVPNVRKEVIERRRIQHLILMLLRMLLLLLLALAFSRPYWTAMATTEPQEEGDTLHVILLDASYSMGIDDWFTQAKDEARTVVEGLESRDRVAVVAFSNTPLVLAPLTRTGDGQAGSHASALDAIAVAELTSAPTAYLPALQQGEMILTAETDPDDDVPLKRVLHLITDFQKTGMPTQLSGWKLSPRIEFNAIEIGTNAVQNTAITDLALRELEGQGLHVRAKVKSWIKEGRQESAVRLFVDGEEQSTNTLMIKAGHATQTRFALETTEGQSIEGYLQIGDDALAADNRRYFAWTPRHTHRALLVTNDAEALRYFTLAIPPGAELPWRLDHVAPDALAAALATSTEKPAIIIVIGVDDLPAAAESSLAQFISDGGRALLTMGTPNGSDGQSDLLASLGVTVEKTRFTTQRDAIFELMSWIDLNHPLFMPFRGPRFNDFSSIRFHNYCLVQTPADSTAVSVLSRFEGENAVDGPPAILAVRHGEGRAIVWTFGVGSAWSNLPKNARFVPLLHETMNYLTVARETSSVLIAGESTVSAPDGASWNLQGPGDDSPRPFEEENLSLGASGFIRWSQGSDEGSTVVHAVNVAALESDPTRIPPTELEIKLCSAPQLHKNTTESETINEPDAGEYVVHYEYGLYLLGALLLIHLVESYLAALFSAA